jgi:ribosome-associated protein
MSPISNTPAPRELKVGDRPINLTQALKLAGCAGSGGDAKALISAGRVQVNGAVELRKRRQLTSGDTIVVHDGLTIVLTS